MITKIHLENFKCIKERQTIELKPITLLFGPNSAGKSTVIQALHYMREILVRQNFNADRTMYGGELIDLGGFQNLVYNHDLKLPIIMQFDLNLGEELPTYESSQFDLENYYYDSNIYDDGEYGYLESEEKELLDEIKMNGDTAFILVKIEWIDKIGVPLVTKYETGFNGKRIASILIDKIINSDYVTYKISNIDFYHPIFKDFDFHKSKHRSGESTLLKFFKKMFNLNENQIINASFKIKDQKSAIPSWSKLINIDFSEFSEDDIYLYYKRWFFLEFFTTILRGPGELLKEILKDLRYLGHVRSIPNRYFFPSKSPNESNWADGLAAYDTLFNSGEEFINDINRYLSGENYLNTNYAIQIKEYVEIYNDIEINNLNSLIKKGDIERVEKIIDNLVNKKRLKRLSFIDTNKDLEISLKDIGVGISQLIPVLVGAVSQEDSILAVEQPELHNHPKIQVALADVFIEQINKKSDVIYLLETHSEHFMLRLLRRIEETTENDVPTKELRLRPEQLSVNWFEPDKKGTKIINLPVDENGEFIKPWPHGFFEERAKELFR